MIIRKLGLSRKYFAPSTRICRPCFQRAQRYVRVKQEDGQIIKEEPAVELYHIEEHDCHGAEDALKEEVVVPINPLDYVKVDTLTDHTEVNQQIEYDPPKQAYTHLRRRLIKQDTTSNLIEPQNISTESHITDTVKQETSTYIDRAVQANEPQMITLTGYTRVPLNSHMCIFETCSNRNLQRINVDTRAAILQKKSLYIPHGAKVCEVHEENLFAAAWQELAELNTRRTCTEFTSQHIGDMLSLLRVHNN